MKNETCVPLANVTKDFVRPWLYRPHFKDWDKSPLLEIRLFFSKFLLIFLFVGCFGNIATLQTLRHYHKLRKSTRLFFFGIAIGDLFGVPLETMFTFYLLHYGQSFVNISPFLCTFYLFPTQACMITSWLFLAAVSTERFLLVWTPQRMLTVNSSRYGLIVALVLIILSMIGASNFLHYSYDDDICACVFSSSRIFQAFWALYMCFLFVFVILQIFFSGFALHQLLKQRRSVVNSVNYERPTGSLSAVKMAIGAGVFRFACVSPHILANFKRFVLKDEKHFFSEGVDLLIDALSLIPLVINNSANFYIYMISSRGFRETFLSSLSNCKVAPHSEK